MAERRTRDSGLPPVVKQLGAVSFFNDVASEMVYPLLPALVTSRLGGGALALGALDGLADAVAAAVKLASGWLADRVRLRGPLVIGGYIVAAVVRPLMGWTSAVWQVIALRASDRLGKGVRNPPRDAVIADAAQDAQRGRAFGFHRAMDHGGAVVGPLIAWLLLTVSTMSPAHVIRWSLLPGLGAVVVVVWTMRRVGISRPARVEPAQQQETAELGQRGAPAVSLFGLIVVFALARFPETLFLLRLQEVGVAVALVPAVWSLLHAVRSVGSYPGGWASDHLGPRRTLLLGWVLYVVTCVGLAVAGTPAVACGWFLLLGVVTALTESPERAFVAASTTARRGRRFGVYHASVGAAALPGGLLLGGVYAWGGGELALLLSAGIVSTLSILGALVHEPTFG